MQRVRNNIHKARKHTQKAKKDIRRLRVRRLRDYYERPLSPATLRAIEETKQFAAMWMEWQKSLEAENAE